MSAARLPPIPDPEAEYEAAKAQFIKAMARMTAAKAVMKPIWEAQYQAKRQARLDMLAKAAEAFLAGAPMNEVAVLGGRSARYDYIPDLFSELWRAYLSHEEIYHQGGGPEAKDWKQRVTALALARHRKGTKL